MSPNYVQQEVSFNQNITEPRPQEVNIKWTGSEQEGLQVVDLLLCFLHGNTFWFNKISSTPLLSAGTRSIQGRRNIFIVCCWQQTLNMIMMPSCPQEMSNQRPDIKARRRPGRRSSSPSSAPRLPGTLAYPEVCCLFSVKTTDDVRATH